MGVHYWWHRDARGGKGDWLDHPPLTRKHGDGPMVVRDIEPYRNTRGQLIGGRRQHREFLRSAGMIEVGNDVVKREAPQVSKAEIVPHVKRALKEQGIGDG